MYLINENWYKADNGKHFVLTERGEKECASYKSKKIGEPVQDYDTEAVRWSVEKGYVIEIDIPNWITKVGYEVVYDHCGYTLPVGNPIVFPIKELAEKYLNNYNKKPWMNKNLYIKEAVYEGKELSDCNKYNGKIVYNEDWVLDINCLNVGDYVVKEFVDDLIDTVPPACLRNDCIQCGEPASIMQDELGNSFYTYTTFKKVKDNVWEYCGECPMGKNKIEGKEIIYVKEDYK